MDDLIKRIKTRLLKAKRKPVLCPHCKGVVVGGERWEARIQVDRLHKVYVARWQMDGGNYYSHRESLITLGSTEAQAIEKLKARLMKRVRDRL